MQRKTPGGTAQFHQGTALHYEDQSSYFNGLSGYEEFAVKGGGPISDIQGYPQNSAAVNMGGTFTNEVQNVYQLNNQIQGVADFDRYENDEDLFIQNDDGSQSANLLMLDGEYD